MTVIRRLDAMLEDSKEAVLDMKKKLDAAKIDNQWPALCNTAGQAFCNASPFRLRDLTSRAKKQTLKADFEAYLDGFSPNVQEILEKFKFRNQIDTMIEADILGAVIEKFISPDINLSPKPVYKDDAQTIVKHPGLDNHGMGTIFEELIRKFNEDNNEEAGEHWTPRDVVELMADLVFMPIAAQIKDATYSCYDGACGTGGMLTVAQDRLLTLAQQQGKNVSIHLFGQEVNPETYAICKADMLLKGDGDQAEHISYGSTLSLDGNATRQFDFMLSNPPYGKSWKVDAEKMGGKKEILDTRFNAYLEGGEQLAMIPRTSDGQLLFLLNNVAKMKKDTPLGSRIAEVHNGSSIFTGDAGSGESNARRYMIENDLVEAIIALPENMFYNTGIGTFIWILSNRKEERRKGKIQLIDATAMKSPLRKNMGKKNCEFTPEIRREIVRIFMEMEQSEVSMIFDNREFGYWSVTVERPLRLHVYPDREIPAGTFKKADELATVKNTLAEAAKTAPLGDWTTFAKATRLKAGILKKIRPFITKKDPTAQPIDGEPDVDLRDTENIPFTYEGGIDAFIRNEVLTYAPDAWVDKKKTIIGYEISFSKYFFKPTPMRDIKSIVADLEELERSTDGMLTDIVGGCWMSTNLFNPSDRRSYPSRWPLYRGKQLFRVIDNRSKNGTEELLSVSHLTGITPRSQKNVTMFQAESLIGYKLCKVGDIVANTMWTWQGAIGVSDYAGVVSPAYNVYRQRGEIYNPRYLDMLLREQKLIDVYHSLSTGIRPSRLRLYPDVFLTICFPVPQKGEQDQIVRFLDWKISQVNRLSNMYRHEITLLEEMKQQLIDSIVTAGLRSLPTIHNKDIRWDIDYPSHWKLQRIRELFSFRKGLSITKANLEESGVPVISYGQIHSKKNSGIGLNDELIRYVNESYLAVNQSAIVKKGDFIFADTSEDIAGCGNCAYIDWNDTIFAGYHSIIAHPNGTMNGKYFAYLFKSSAWRYQIRKKANSVKVYSITQKMLKDAFILIPPTEEQAEIVTYLDNSCSRIDAIINKTEAKISNLHDLKVHLIADAVTGKIDVRDIKVPEYEFVEEDGDGESEESVESVEGEADEE